MRRKKARGKKTAILAARLPSRENPPVSPKKFKPTRAARKVDLPHPATKGTALASPAQGRTSRRVAEDPAARAARLGLRAPAILFEGDEPLPAQTPSPDAKYADPIPLAPRLSELQASKSPEPGATRRLLLAARDPHCLYAHWDLAPEADPLAHPSTNGHPLRLRVHLEDINGPHVGELPIPSESRHSFIRVGTAGARYVAELGYYDPRNGWKSLAVSQSAITPRDAAAEAKTVHFATFPLEVPLARPVEQTNRPNTGRPAGSTTLPVQPPEAKGTEPAPVDLTFANPIIAVGAHPLRGGQFPLVTATPVLTANPVLPSEVPKTPGEGDLESANWTTDQEEALAAFIGWTSLEPQRPDSAQVLQLVQPPTQQPSPPLGIFPQALEPTWQQPEGISSHGAEPLPDQGPFWLRVNAELVVYGATEPRANVSIGGRAIRLRSDGTFSVRFALPDGRYELPVAAVSARGEVRQVHLAFQRSTAFADGVDAEPSDPTLTPPAPNALT